MKHPGFITFLAVLTMLAAYPALAERWVPCGAENQYCDVPGTRMVRYGANGRWSSKMVTRGINCGNDAFGDPAPGVVKACYYQDTASQGTDRRSYEYDGRGYSGQDDKRHHRRWVRCADEGGFCRFHGHKEIRYGVDGRWSTKTARNGVRCGNDVFGDPAPGVSKACYVDVD